MEVEILYFGGLRKISGQQRETLLRPPDDTLSNITRVLTEKYGDRFKARISDPDRYGILINGRHHQTIPENGLKLKNGDQIVFLPVTMGG